VSRLSTQRPATHCTVAFPYQNRRFILGSATTKKGSRL
jgi:hypothetical protein